MGKRIFLVLFCISFVCGSFCEARIIQTNRISDVLEHIDENTWVFLDLDDTLFTSIHHLGKSEFYCWEHSMLKDLGIEGEEAHRICRMRWDERQERCPIRLLEPDSHEVVRQIQEISAYTTGLTARGPRTFSLTLNQLHSVGISFADSALPAIFVDLPIEHLYQQGIWFVENNNKGLSVRKWLETHGEHPAKIVFVDDRRSHVEHMEKALSDLDIEYVGVHYCKFLEMPFDLEIARLQADAFPRVLTNEEALERLGR